jgi:hypothetical protein
MTIFRVFRVARMFKLINKAKVGGQSGPCSRCQHMQLEMVLQLKLPIITVQAVMVPSAGGQNNVHNCTEPFSCLVCDMHVACRAYVPCSTP